MDQYPEPRLVMGDVSPLLGYGAADREGIGRAALCTGISAAWPQLLDARDDCRRAGTVWSARHRHDALPARARRSPARYGPDATEFGVGAEATAQQGAAGEAKAPHGSPPALR